MVCWVAHVIGTSKLTKVVEVYDLTLGTDFFDFSSTDWATIHDRPLFKLDKYASGTDGDEMQVRHWPAIAILAYTVHTYSLARGLGDDILSNDIQFTAVLARLDENVNNPVFNVPMYWTIWDQYSNRGDFNIPLSEVEQSTTAKKGKGKRVTADVNVFSSKAGLSVAKKGSSKHKGSTGSKTR